MLDRCGCEYGRNCTKVSVCQMNNALEERQDELDEAKERIRELEQRLSAEGKFPPRLAAAL